MPLRRFVLPLTASLLTGFLLQDPADKFEYYLVYGSTPDDVRQSINTLGPAGVNGGHFDASTRSQVSWKWTTTSDPAACRFTTFTVTVATTYMLPKWRDEGLASSTTAQAWRTYLLALKRHETGHKKIALQGADSIRAIVGRMPAQSDCGVLTKMAGDSGRAVLARVSEAQKKYDLDTEHGRSQGARFPDR